MANKAKKTKAGSWRVQVYDYTDASGKKHVRSFTAPTKAQAELEAAAFARAKKTRRQALNAGTVGALVDEYIQLMTPTLSPSTIAGYKRARRNGFPELMATPVSRLTASKIQQAINAEVARPKNKGASALTPKTIRNEWGVISAALAELAGVRFSPKLPAYQVAPKQLPEPSEVMAAVHGSDVELPVLLALCLSLTMSEIRGLYCSDVDGGFITIRRTVVDTEAGPVLKDTGKTATRLRRLVLPAFIAELINRSEVYKTWLKTGKDGPIEPRHRNIVYRHFKRDMAAAGLSLTFHNLRALNASAMLAIGVPDKYAMERGGWKTPAVMKRNYQNTLDSTRRLVDDRVNAHFAAIYNQNDNDKKS